MMMRYLSRMGFLLVTLIATPLVLAQGEAATASEVDKLHFQGSLRTRFEYKDNFRFGLGGGGTKAPGNREELFLTQLRFQLDWRPTDHLNLILELQDARLFNESTAINDDATPNIFADDLDIHQAYLDWGFKWGSAPARLRLGRQKLNLGAKRLVASLEWVNTARVWDAARLTIGEEGQFTWDVFASRVVPVDPGSANDWASTGNRLWNSAFHGIYYTDWRWLEGGRVELYYLLRNEDDIDDQIHTFGGRIDRRRGRFDFNVELALQDGRWGGLDHRAAAGHVELGWRPVVSDTSSLRDGRLNVAYNYGSGDSDPRDDKHETFDNLYPLNHAYYGYMDFFALQNVHNVEVAWKVPVGQAPKKTTFRVAWQSFWLAEPESDAWYNAGAGVVRRASSRFVSSEVGHELDITVSRPFVAWGHKLATEVGYGHFLTGDYVAETGPSEDADFVYLQAKIGF